MPENTLGTSLDVIHCVLFSYCLFHGANNIQLDMKGKL